MISTTTCWPMCCGRRYDDHRAVGKIADRLAVFLAGLHELDLQPFPIISSGWSDLESCSG